MENNDTNTQPSIAQVAISRIRDVDWFMVDFSEEVEAGYRLKERIKVWVQLQHRVEAESKLMYIRTSVGFHLPTEGDETRPALKYTADVIYEIANFSEVFKGHEDDEYEVPNQFLVTLCSLAISTVRGLLTGKVANSYLRDIYLPVMSPGDVGKILGL